MHLENPDGIAGGILTITGLSRAKEIAIRTTLDANLIDRSVAAAKESRGSGRYSEIVQKSLHFVPLNEAFVGPY